MPHIRIRFNVCVDRLVASRVERDAVFEFVCLYSISYSVSAATVCPRWLVHVLVYWTLWVCCISVLHVHPLVSLSVAIKKQEAREVP